MSHQPTDTCFSCDWLSRHTKCRAGYKFTVCLSFILYGYGFLTWGFTDRHEILRGGLVWSQTGLLPFWGIDSPRDGWVMGVNRDHMAAYASCWSTCLIVWHHFIVNWQWQVVVCWWCPVKWNFIHSFIHSFIHFYPNMTTLVSGLCYRKFVCHP